MDEKDLHQLLFRARKRIEALEQGAASHEPVAVVGLACRFPGARDAGAFWSNLVAGVDGVGPLRDGRWDTAALVGTGTAPEPGRMRTADGGFLTDIRAFDAAFFGISGREAEYMDPQQRLLLETAWHALEDAGILPASLSGTDAGVFVGISSADYGFLQAGGPAAREAWAGTGNALSIAANRLSYVLNLGGPSLAVDTACSSSLVAVHQAVRSLRLKETGLALVGGVNVLLNPDVSIAFSQAGMMSPTGRCRTFDAAADGYVRAEGVGVLVLKRLKDAERDGDAIRAVIAGSAVNQDGRGNGLTAPNGLAQQAVVRAALKDAMVEVKDVAYVEAHGTGTPLGDPIELNNLAKVMAGREGAPVLVGAVKAAIGHTEAAAGVAGLIKTVLAMEAGTIPGQLHLDTLNPRLKEAAETVVTPVRGPTPWPDDRPAAGVSAFGFGGANAHVVLKRARRAAPKPAPDGPETGVLTLSARSETALAALAASVAAAPPADPVAFAASLAARRTTHAHRLALPVRRGDPAAVAAALTAHLDGEPGRAKAGRRLGTRAPRVVFAYTGQGAQAPGMGAALYAGSPVFRDTLDRLAAGLRDSLGLDLKALLFDTPAEDLRRTENAQPAIAALQLALTADLAARGITPDAVMGYSLGEYVAASVAGALDADAMLALIARRGALIGALPEGGAMLSLRAPGATVEALLSGAEDALSVAARLGPEATVVAGSVEAIEALATRAAEAGVTARRLSVSHAFHSPLVEPALPALHALCAAADLTPLRLPLVSNLDGAVRAPGTVLSPDHWTRHTRAAVDYARCLETLAKDPTTIVLEIGPNGTLTALGRATRTLPAERFLAALPKADAGVDAVEDAVAALVAHGVDLPAGLLGAGTLPGAALPLYPFDRTIHWLEPARREPAAVPRILDPLAAVSAALAAEAAAAEAGGGDLHRLFADQLDLVRRTIASQLAALKGRDDGLPTPDGTPDGTADGTSDDAPDGEDGEDAAPAAGPAPEPDRPAIAAAARVTQTVASDPGPVAADAPAPRMRPAAELIWLLSQKSDDASRAYHIPVLLRLEGPLDPAHVEAAVGQLLVRHEALRARYPAPGVMEIRHPADVAADFVAVDGRGWSAATEDAWVAALGEAPFDLARDLLLRVRLLRTGEERWLLSLEAHHLVTDGLSMNVVVGELAALVNAMRRGAPADLPPALSYRDHLAAHHAARASDRAAADRAYWLARLGEGAPSLALATDRPRGAKTFRGDSVLTVIEPAEAEALRRAARGLGLTPFMLLHTLFAVALARLGGQRQVAIATPTAGRPEDLAGPLVGYCSDLMFSLVTVEPDAGLPELARRARGDLLADLSHAGYSFAWIAEDLRPRGVDLPLQVVFNYQNTYGSAPFEGLSARVEPRRLGYLDGEFTLNAVDVQGRLALELVFNTGLYEPATARAVLAAMTGLVAAVAAGARGPVGTLALMTPETGAALDRLARGESWPAPAEPPVRLIERVATVTPDAVAVVQGAESLTYGALDARANALAHRLIAAGVTAEALVGIHLPRSIDLIVAELAISKAGGAFVVLDHRQPAERRRRIVERAGIRVVVGPAGDLAAEGVAFLDAGPGDAPATAPAVTVPVSALMYVIFTSGSTGEPKGVMIEHASVANYVAWLGRRLGVTAADRVLQFAALGFDASIEEIYTALTHGASLTLREEHLPESAAAFWSDLDDKAVTILDLPTAFWHGLMWDEAALARMPARLRHVILGGEAAKPAAVKRWRALAPATVSLWNTYGPTETTIVATAARINDVIDLGEGPTPIGTPVANAVALVLDETLQPVPPGAVGMLYIGGSPVLARGYLGRPDLTDAAFVTATELGGRFYRTGDRVRWRADGLLEYHGRADGQVKIRGFRIETSEIEAVLERQEAVAAAAVVADEDGAGVTRLAAYVVPAAGLPIDRAALRAALARVLPDYMVPQAMLPVDRLPLNANGKVDRKGLPAIDWPAELAGAAAAGTDGAPLDEREAAVAAVWGEVLGLDPAALSPDSDFFLVGGDSLSAMRVLTRLGATTGAGLTARDLFRASRLGDLARLLAGAAAAAPVAVPVLDRDRPLPLSPGQRRLWFLHQLDPAHGTYNLPSRIELTGPLERTRVDAALAALVARHEALRTRFTDADGEPAIVIEAAGALPLAFVDLSDRPDADAAVDAAATAMSVAPFDLAQAPLVRATLFRRSAERHTLVFAAHHIVTDGWSMAILARDFAAAYAGDGSLAAPPVPGAVDFAAAIAAERAKADPAPLKAYWRGRLGDLPEVLELPTDRPRPDVPNGEGRVHRFALDRAAAERVRAAARAIGVTPFAVLFSAWGLTLARLSGQGAFAIGTVEAGRGLPGTEEVVGFFADTLALRFDAADQPDFATLCRRSQQDLLDGLAHQALPFEAIVEDLVTERSDGHAPIFQTLFVWQNTPTPTTRIGDLTLSSQRLDKGATQFDLVLDMTEGETGIDAMLEYRTQLFDADTVAAVGARFSRLLDAALAAPQSPVGRLAPEAAAVSTVTAMPDIADARVDAVMDGHARARPEAVAVTFEAADGAVSHLSWGAFEAEAARLAAHLQARGIGAGARVVIAAERSLRLMVALYAVMKAGAAYVPLDPAAPADRQRALLAAAEARLLIADEGLLPLFAEADGRVPVPVLRIDEPVPEPAAPVRPESDPGLPIYVIFTSGTTGTPKGVVVPHRGVANMALGMGRVLGVTGDDSLLQFAPLNFDASALQLFVPLLAGGRAVLHHAPGRLGARDFMDLAVRHGLTMLDLPAALWRQWVETMTEEGMTMAPSIRLFFTGGEALSTRTMRRWAALCPRTVAFLSSYGPTEASITATAYVSDSAAMAGIGDGAPDIGRPLPNVAIHILDLFGAPAAPGTIGEIAIGGPGVAIGYLGDAERTAAAFVERPGLGRVYLTGDYGRLTRDGTFEFHGRRDAQIKIRGFRIEPAEVEGAMRAHPGVSEALVAVQKTADRRAHLVAYAVPADGTTEGAGAEALAADLRARLAASLPEHMVPAGILLLPAMPLLPNGKTDRRALPPVPVAALASAPFEAPRAGPESVLADIWQAMLGVDRVGRADNFFELGGDSILSLQLAARARRAGLLFEVRDVFRHQTLAALAAAARADGAGAAEQGPVTGRAALPPVLAALAARTDLAPERLDLTLPPDLPADRLAAALAAALRHHDGLGVRFADADGPALILEGATVADVLVEAEPSDAPRAIAEAARAVMAGAPHLAAVHVTGQPGRLVLLAHPAAIDAESWRILAADLARLAAGEPLPAKTASLLAAAAALADRAPDPDEPAPSRRQGRFALPADTVAALAGPALGAFRVTAREIVLTALLAALGRQGLPAAADVTLAGRDGLAGLDVSRTVGRFARTESLAFDRADDPRLALAAVKDRIRLGGAVPQAAPDVLLAEMADVALPDGWSARAATDAPVTRHALVVRYDGGAGALVIDHADAVWPREAVETLAADVAAGVVALADLCTAPGAGGPTRADVPLATVTQAEIDRIAARVPDLETLADASFGQAGMLFHSLLAPESGAFLLQTRISFSTGLDVGALKAAVLDLTRRHPVLRTGFLWEDRAQPLQVVRRSVDLPWEEADVSGEADEDAALDRLAAADLARPLDLAAAPLMRLTLVRRRAGSTLVWLKHHAVVDGWSMPLLTDDLIAAYAARAGGRAPAFGPAPGFDRYIAWLKGFDRAAAERHWAGELAGFEAPTDLGLGRGAAAETGAIGRAERHLDPAAFARLMARARAERVTLATLVMGAWSVLLARTSGQAEVLSNVTVAGRPHDLPGAEDIVGMFLNALPLRAEVDDGAGLWPWLRALQDRHAANDALGHLGLLDVQKASGVATGQRLAETLVIVQNTPLGAAMAGGAGLAGLVTGMSGLQKTSAPLTLFAEGEGRGLRLAVQYDAGRYAPDDMDTLAARLERILAAMAEGAALGDLRLLSAAEEADVIARSEGPAVPAPEASSLIALFEAEAAARPDAVALFDGIGHVTYADLDDRAARIAGALIAAGVAPGTVVAVLAERTPDTTAALLGIMKAGAAFLALDPTYPPARLAMVMADSGAVLLLSGRDVPDGLAAVAPRRLTLAAALAAEPVAGPGAARLTPDDLAYLIYTSGSTGQPKGVRALHRGALNRFSWMWRAMPFADGEVMVQKTALSFVDCIWEIFGPLLKGVPSLVLPDRVVRDVPDFVDLLADHGVSRLILVPTLLRAMLELHPDLSAKLPRLTHWISSGEALSADLVRDFRRAAPGARLFNLYGTSEVAGDVTWFDTAEMPADGTRPASLGRPMDNTAVYLLDAGRRPVPDGLPGELYIGGANLAEGYHGRPELSADAFVPNPFGPGLLFRSRDFGRREADGTITFLGRQDGQVKIRGMRVDLAEVDAALKDLSAVTRGVVLNRPGADRRARIVAWYVGTAEPAEIRRLLEARLPRHMVPAALVRLDAVPLLPNGKVDRRALPDPADEASAPARTAPPRTPTEIALARIVAEVLDRRPEDIGRTDSFFHLGGDSISAIRVATRAAAAGLPIAVRDFFETETLAGLAARLDEKAGPALTALALGADVAALDVADWRILHLALDPPRPAAAVDAALEALRRRHDLLRARLERQGEGAVLAFDGAPAHGALPAVTIDTESAEDHVSGLILRAHPLLLDAAGWAAVDADLRALLAGRALPGRAPSLRRLPPAIPAGTTVVARPDPSDWPDLDLADLIAGAAATLRADAPALIAAALLSAAGDRPVAVIVPDRPAGTAGLATHRERTILLPPSAGDAAADLKAAKTALRGDGPAEEGAALTVRLITAGAGATFAVPALAFAPDAPPHLELLLADGVLSAEPFGADAADAAADLADRFGAALAALAARAGAPDPASWTPGDFPLAPLGEAGLVELASRYPDAETVLAATPGQTGMLFHALADPENAVYAIHTALRLAAGVDADALDGAFQDLVARHAILRTTFDWSLAERPVQVVHRRAAARLLRVDLSALDPAAHAARRAALVAADRARPIDLAAAPALRATLVTAPDGTADLLIAVHHAVVDGWSLPLLLGDLIALYDARTGLRTGTLADAPDFSAYIGWLAAQDGAAARAHWRTVLGSLTAGTDLVVGRGTEAETGIFATRRLVVPAAVLAPLAARARAEGVTVSTLLQGAWAAMLARTNQAESQVFGVTVSGRPADLPGIEEAVGPFVNVLPLVVPTRDDADLWSWLRTVQETHARNDGFNHLSFADIQALSALPPGERLADSMLVFQNFPLDGGLVARLSGGTDAGLAGLVRDIDGHQTTSYALTLFAVPDGEGLAIDLVHDAGRFDAATVDALSARLLRVFESMGTATRLGEVEILSADERAALVALAAGPDRPAPVTASALALFEARADATPDAVALIHEEHAVTYAEIEAAANLLARALAERAIGRGAVVAIHMDRSPLLVAALLAVLKAGAAWLPLDPAYPADRLAFMVEDAGAALVLTDGGPLAFAPAAPVLDAGETLSELAAGEPAPRVPSALTPDDLAYLIYTSGSTGRPKGVRALHRGLLNRLAWSWRAYPYAPGEVAVLKTALPFVDSVAEIFGPLLAGVPMVVVPGEDVADIPRLVDLMERHRVTWFVLVPSLLRAILDLPPETRRRLAALRTVVVSGEACTAELVAAVRAGLPGVRLLNFYGSSEVAGDVTAFDTAAMDVTDPRAPVPIGRPIPRSATYILDRRLVPVPAGLPGELYVAGDNLADGYHGRPDLTAEAFLPDPFGPGRLFRTRDWARWNADGMIEFLGRQDGQIKIRGMRVEIGEVEAVLRAAPGVEDAVVRAVPAPAGGLALAAYWSGPAEAGALAATLSARLAPHMLPSHYVKLAALPLLPNGKIDRRALPAPERAGPRGEGAAPDGYLERLLAPVFAEVLGQPGDAVPATEDFFALGGHSLAAARAMAEIGTRTGVTLRLRQFYGASTLRDVAAAIEADLLADLSPDDLAALVAEARAAAGDPRP